MPSDLGLGLALTLLSALACQTSEMPDPPAKNPGLVKLDIEPTTITLRIDSSQPADFDFKAMGLFSGRMVADDISRKVVWEVGNPALGGFGADSILNRFRSSTTRGGKTKVTATSFPVAPASADVTIIYSAALIRADAPVKAPENFRDATDDATLAPQITGPDDGAAMDKTKPVAFRWTPAAGTDLFELSFSNDITDLRVYTKASEVTPSPEEWAILGNTNAGGTVNVKVRGMKSSDSARAGSASAIAISFPR